MTFIVAPSHLNIVKAQGYELYDQLDDFLSSRKKRDFIDAWAIALGYTSWSDFSLKTKTKHKDSTNTIIFNGENHYQIIKSLIDALKSKGIIHEDSEIGIYTSIYFGLIITDQERKFYPDLGKDQLPSTYSAEFAYKDGMIVYLKLKHKYVDWLYGINGYNPNGFITDEEDGLESGPLKELEIDAYIYEEKILSIRATVLDIIQSSFYFSLEETVRLFDNDASFSSLSKLCFGFTPKQLQGYINEIVSNAPAVMQKMSESIEREFPNSLLVEEHNEEFAYFLGPNFIKIDSIDINVDNLTGNDILEIIAIASNYQEPNYESIVVIDNDLAKSKDLHFQTITTNFEDEDVEHKFFTVRSFEDITAIHAYIECD